VAEHRADGIQVFGVVPEITQLFNSRYRLTFRCELGDNEEAWYYDNKENIFAEFGTLMDAGYGHTPATPDPESTWPNQRLISHELQYIPQKDVQVLTFIYETLTSTWTKEQEDVRGSTANGLRTLTRTQVAKIDTTAPYDEDDVGVATITDNGKTLYLAGFEDQSKADDQVQIGRFVTRWAEAGILSVRTPRVGGQQLVVVDAIGADEATVVAAISEVTANHKLVDQNIQDYEGFQAKSFTFEVDDFEVISSTTNGLKVITRTQLSETNFTSGDVGVDTYSGLFLAGEEIENDNVIKKRVSRWAEAGIILVDPVTEGTFSEVQQYVFRSVGLPPSVIHATTPLTTPSGTQLDANVTFYEPTVENFEGYPTFTQLVTNIQATAEGALVHSREDFFEIIDPGVMTTGFITSSSAESASAVRFPQATSKPRRYRKKGLVQVYLTTSSTISETEVAYSNENTDWADITFYNYYFNDRNGSSDTTANWRTFDNYLIDEVETDTAYAFSNNSGAGVIESNVSAFKRGSTTYTTTGNYRVILNEYEKGPDGTQYYLKTIVSFS